MAQNALARERLFALRETIAKLEGKPAPALAAAEREALASGKETRQAAQCNGRGLRLPFGVTSLDEAMEGGLPLDAITEIRSSLLRNAGAACGFALAAAALLQRLEENDGDRSPILWIGDTISTMEAGLPYAVGLQDFGLRPDCFLFALPRKLEEALWLAESAVESGAFSVVILEIRGNPAHFGLTESRRLGLRAKAAGRPLFLLRQAGEEEASSAVFRLLAEPAPSGMRSLPNGSRLAGSIGNPVFRLSLEKSRNPAPLSLLLEWNPHERQFFPVGEPRHALTPDERSAYPGAQFSASTDRQDRPQKMGTFLAFERAS
ncbi:hypothetical protein ATY78_24175 [Rhizobium sp. R635]|uniref:ImuA family protein n=1 Tax=Rhizobium sp. R635 TaxID=1764275 RepID=UPI000B6C77BC|nr:hypothetical protein [Rhizobium sp. R635]OWV86255.1 hypothetical protein ATY78_24175 [Rhizobium sp. R635]